MRKNKPRLKEKLKYRFDNLMSKGTIVLVLMLFLITAGVIVLAGVIGALFNKDLPTGDSIWASFMNTLDAGNLSGNDMSNTGFIIMMTIVTLCGIFVTSILIGIITSGFEQKLFDLRKGASKVIESGHTVIIGFSDSVYTILTELIEAGANQKKNRIVVLGQIEKDEMEEAIKGRIQDFKTTRVICKSGNLTEGFVLERASLETCRSIIINQEDDFSVIKTLLAVVSYLKSKDAFNGDMHITTMIHNKENLEAARIAGEGKAEVLYFKDAISRIIAHTCRQPGLSFVLTEFFDFGGDEFYFENFPELEGKKFGDILNLFEISTVVGLEHDGKVMLNPPMDTVLHAQDCVIHLAQDDGASKPQGKAVIADTSAAASVNNTDNDNGNLLVLGYNEYLPDILAELDNYASAGTAVAVAVPKLPESFEMGEYANISVIKEETDIYDRKALEILLKDRNANILLLSDLESDTEEADAKTLLLLIHIRDIGKKWGRVFNLTSEMRSVSNQGLARIANVNDFIVGSTITNLIIAQVSENRRLSLLFEDLLDADGSELYMKKASRYVKTGAEVDFYTLTEIAKARNEIVVGYKKAAEEGIQVITNPKKNERVSFAADDFLILICEDSR